MTKCADCMEAPAEFRDPRTPPLEEGDHVLCRACYAVAIQDRVEEIMTEIGALAEEAHSHGMLDVFDRVPKEVLGHSVVAKLRRGA